MRWRRKIQDFEIAPDEIFLDSANTSAFDQGRFEGRLERPLGRPTYLFLGLSLALLGSILAGQSWNLQFIQGTAYAAQSEKNSLRVATLFASRGALFDSKGVPLAQNEILSATTTLRSYRTPGFAHLVGYVAYPKKDASGNYYDTTETGLAGLEARLNESLAGTNGRLLVERDAVGTVKSQGTVIAPVAGEDITLTIDARVQKAFFDSIKSLADKIPFSGGAGILMEVNSGAVRALVSYPEYDSNVLSEGSPAAEIARYANDPRKFYLDRAVAGLYAPGSVVKPLEAAGALTDGIITPETSINDTGSISIPNPYDPAHPTIFPDWKALGWEDLRKAIAWSSDVYFYMVGGGYQSQGGLGIERLAYWYRAFGLEAATGIELPNEGEGFVPTPSWKEATYDEPWRIGDTYHTAIGQYAMQVTPIEMARAIAAIANGGKLIVPTLIEGKPMTGESIAVSQKALQVVREGMRQGVTEGTSVGLMPLDSLVHIAGKTGTAQTGVHNEFYNSWAVGFFPYENPKYVYVVMMDHGPSGNSTGAVYATLETLTALYQAAPEYFQ